MTGLVGRIEGSGSGESGPGDSGKVALLQRAEFIGNHVLLLGLVSGQHGRNTKDSGHRGFFRGHY